MTKTKKQKTMCRGKQKMFLMILLVLLVFSVTVFGAEYTPDSSRLPSDGIWTNIGVEGGIPTNRTQCTGAWGTTLNTSYCSGACDDEIQAAINSCPSNTYLKLGTGTFTFNNAVQMPENKTIRGSGSGEFSTTNTHIDSNGTAFKIGNCTGSYPYLNDIYTGAQANISSGYTKGSNQIVVSSASSFAVGDLVIITQTQGDTSDGYTISISGGNGATLENPVRVPGQISKITNISGTTVTLADKLNYTYQSARTPQMVRVKPFGQDADYYRAGVEDLYIHRPSPTYSNTISMWAADQCWIKNVTITPNCAQQGCGSVYLGLSYRCEIRDSYFHHDCTYQSGGNGYIMTLNAYTSNSLIVNNILSFANEGLFLKNTNGNVIAYNYLDSSWVNEGGTLMMADYGTHAEWPYMDLIEGNFATKFETGGVWGGASRLFFFRNYHDARHQWNSVVNGDPDPTAHNSQDRSAFQSQSKCAYMTYIGNIAGIAGDTALSYESASANSIFFYRSGLETQDNKTALHGYSRNLTNNTTTWDDVPSGNTIRNSYYLSSKPSWWCSETPWPPIGPDISGYVNDIPAKRRFDGAVCTIASESDTTPPAAITNLSTSNPTSSSITLSWTSPGDDDNTGTAASYDIRYSTSNITDTNWSSAIQVSGPSPLVAGSPQSMTITGLLANTSYYFAIKTSDEVSKVSGLSNVRLAKTSSFPSTYTLTVAKSGTGSGTVTGTGIDCGSDCTETVSSGDSITLTASPDSGSVFSGWSGGCSGTGTCTLTMNSNIEVIATFNQSGIPVNLLTNGDFESGFTSGLANGWQMNIDGGVACSVSQDTGYQGSSQKITVTTPGSWGFYFYQTPAFQLNQSYIWSFWYKTQGADLWAQITNGPCNQLVFTKQLSDTNGTWQQATLNFQYTNTQADELRFYSNTQGTYWFDNIQLVATTDTTPPAEPVGLTVN